MIKMVESFDYFAPEFNTIWDHTKNGVGEIRMNDGVYCIKDTRYPKYFRREESFDAHFCDDWFEVTMEEFNDYISKQIRKKYAEIDELKKMIAQK